jgi:hypothetical protein
MSAKLVYETKACGRCGGSGHYSYCSMYGTTCFGCRGRKKILSAAGSKAAAAVKAFIAEHYSATVRDLTVGDLVNIDGVTRRLTKVEFSGTYGSSNGVPYESWTIEFNKPVKSPYGAYSSMGMSGDATLVKGVTGADWDRVVAFARTLKKGVTVAEAVAA